MSMVLAGIFVHSRGCHLDGISLQLKPNLSNYLRADLSPDVQSTL